MVAGTTWRTVVAVAALGAGVVGCSGEDPPEEYVPTPTSPASSASSDGPTGAPSTPVGTDDPPPEVDGPPELPVAATRDTRRGAEAFVRHYVDLLNYATQTGDTSALKAASDRCSGCDNYIEIFDDTYSSGGFLGSAGWDLTRLEAYQNDPGTAVLFEVDSPRYRYRSASGEAVTIARPGHYKLRAVLLRQRAAWVVRTLERQLELP